MKKSGAKSALIDEHFNKVQICIKMIKCHGFKSGKIGGCFCKRFLSKQWCCRLIKWWTILWGKLASNLQTPQTLQNASKHKFVQKFKSEYIIT